MSISKRNFESIALAFRRVRAEGWTDPETALDQLAEQLAVTFGFEHDGFDRERFLDRCANTDKCVACRTFHHENLDCPSEALDRQALAKPLTMDDSEHPHYGMVFDEVDPPLAHGPISAYGGRVRNPLFPEQEAR